MAEIDNSYRANVGREQGGGLFYMKAAGLFKFFDTDMRGDLLKALLQSPQEITQWVSSDSVLATSLFSPVYGYHIFTATTAVSKGSAKLGIPSVGMTLYLNFDAYAGDANISVFASTGGGVTGVSLINAGGVALSSFDHSAVGLLKLICFADGCWSVVEKSASYTEHLAA